MSIILRGNNISHLEKFIALYREVGIELIPEYRAKLETNNGKLLVSAGITLTISENSASRYIASGQDKIEGYSHFYTELYFDKKGNFIKQGIWE